MDNQTEAPPDNSGEKQAENKISERPVSNLKSAELKRFRIRILATLVVVGVLGAVWFVFLKNGSNQTPSRANDQANQNSTPTPTPLLIDSSAWEMTLAKDEVTALTNLAESNLVYAVKNEHTSTVYKRDLQSGTQTKILEFVENKRADKSGNAWTGLPPSVALSQDRKSLAFADKEGLKVYDLQTKKQKLIFVKSVKASVKIALPYGLFTLVLTQAALMG